nr:hypothetical protein P9270_002230 [Mesorhizobium sp. WSM4875]
MNEDDPKGASPEDMRHASRGWAFFIVMTTAIFGAAYALIEM